MLYFRYSTCILGQNSETILKILPFCELNHNIVFKGAKNHITILFDIRIPIMKIVNWFIGNEAEQRSKQREYVNQISIKCGPSSNY